MFVITADQYRSTQRGDLVEDALERAQHWLEPRQQALALSPERTVGDEIQAVFLDAFIASEFALWLYRTAEWSVGLGAGPADEPLGSSARASRGQAFLHARSAVEQAKRRGEPQRIVAHGQQKESARAATAVLQLLGGIALKRSSAGWEAIDHLASGLSRAQAATRIGVSQEALSQRLRTAMWEEERRALPVAAELLTQSDS